MKKSFIFLTIHYNTEPRLKYIETLEFVLNELLDGNFEYKILSLLSIEDISEYINVNFYNREKYLFILDKDINLNDISKVEYTKIYKMIFKNFDTMPNEQELYKKLKSKFKVIIESINAKNKQVNQNTKVNLSKHLNDLSGYTYKLQEEFDNLIDGMYKDGLLIETDTTKFIIVPNKMIKKEKQKEYNSDGIVVLTIKDAYTLALILMLTNSNIKNINVLEKENEKNIIKNNEIQSK